MRKGSFGKWAQKSPFSGDSREFKILENLEILEILENPQMVESKGESDQFLEILELEILDIPPVKRALS